MRQCQQEYQQRDHKKSGMIDQSGLHQCHEYVTKATLNAVSGVMRILTCWTVFDSYRIKENCIIQGFVS
jgi:hypothetical protein